MMKSNFVRYGLQLISLGVVIFILVKIGPLFLDFISRSNPTVGAAVIAASVTVLVSVFSLVWTRRQDRLKEIEQRRWEIEQEIRKEKLNNYSELMEFLFKVFSASRKGDQLPVDEINAFFDSFTQKTLIWGSDRYIKDYGNFRSGTVSQTPAVVNQTGQPDEHTITTMKRLEKLLYTIRADYGHDNKGLKDGDLLKLFINDIRDYIDRLQTN